MRIERVRVRRVGAGEDGEAWRAALGDAEWVGRARVLKEEGHAWVRRTSMLGRDVVVKCRPLHTAARRAKAALGFGHADRHWRGADALARIGVRTARAFASARGEVDGEECELLALECLPGRSLLEVLASIARGDGPSVREQHAIARAAAGTIGALMVGKKWNRDHKPSNLIVTRSDPIAAEIAVIDCVGIRNHARMGRGEGEAGAMAASLILEPIGCGCPPRRALWMTCLRAMMIARGLDAPRAERRAAMRTLIEEINAIVGAHGDPRPKVNPLAQ